MGNWDGFDMQAEPHPEFVHDARCRGARAATGPRARPGRGGACYL